MDPALGTIALCCADNITRMRASCVLGSLHKLPDLMILLLPLLSGGQTRTCLIGPLFSTNMTK